MVELNDNLEIKEEVLYGSKIYIIDNFYKDPDSLVEYLMSIEPSLWKENEKPSYNGIHFEDRKHEIVCKEMEPVFLFLQSICGDNLYDTDEIVTNLIRFKKSRFNDFRDCYWSPHTDKGYTALIYLNKGDTQSGTNLYQKLDPSEPPRLKEHEDPWRPKSKYRLLKHMEPKYNRMVLYNGKKFIHGMNICNYDYFHDTYRINQVCFFQDSGKKRS